MKLNYYHIIHYRFVYLAGKELSNPFKIFICEQTGASFKILDRTHCPHREKFTLKNDKIILFSSKSVVAITWKQISVHLRQKE